MKVVILGLGQYPKGSGVAAALYFAKQGHEVIATDLKKANQLAENVKTLKKFKNVRFALGRHDKKDLAGADLVVRNPRVRKDLPEMKEAVRLGIPLESDLSIFLKACPCPVIGITGTRGKSTTTTMTYEILRASKKWRRVWLGGNILVSPLTFLHQVKESDIVVLEMSSFQLEGLGDAGRSPQVALITNLMRDHLNTYASMEEYAEAKAQIFRHQSAEDLVLLPSEKAFDAYASEAPGSVYRWGKQASPEAKLVRGSKLKVKGEHNVRNAEAAAAVALLLGVSKSVVKKLLEAFKGLENRLEIVAVKRGITFVNDTTSTTPDATLAALGVYRVSGANRVHLIFGGADKELEFDEIARALGKRKDVAVYLLPGTAERKIKTAFKKTRVSFDEVKHLKDAFQKITKSAKSGDVVLLSPGSASFGLFKNEFDRGDQFKKLVKTYGR